MQTLNEDFEKQSINLLKRKGDVLAKIYARQNKNEDLLNLLVQWAQAENNTNSRVLALYIFEILADVHLTGEQMTTYKDSFMTLFSKALTDREVTVRVAALKATTSFLTSIDDSEMVMQYAGVVPQILNTVVEALKENEEYGRQALESMNELTTIHSEIWKTNTNQLVNVVSQVMMQKTFENGTRAAAVEVILALAQNLPASLRKIDETKTLFIPALVQMLTEVEEDLSVWSETLEESNNTDPYNTAVNAINRASTDLGGKLMLATVSGMIQQLTKSSDWKERQAGYILMGLIAESAKDSIKKSMDEAMKLACQGIMDENPRVRYAGLSCLALLLTELSPKAQNKYHADLMPVLMAMMNNETLLKIQTHTVSTIINFARGLLAEDEDEETTNDKIFQ